MNTRTLLWSSIIYTHLTCIYHLCHSINETERKSYGIVSQMSLFVHRSFPFWPFMSKLEISPLTISNRWSTLFGMHAKIELTCTVANIFFLSFFLVFIIVAKTIHLCECILINRHIYCYKINIHKPTRSHARMHAHIPSLTPEVRTNTPLNYSVRIYCDALGQFAWLAVQNCGWLSYWNQNQHSR